MDQEILRKLQLTELNILLTVDSFCKKHKIQYSLYSGTALGAVRHGGFIPWDDDIDIMMVRTEYDRFCSLWQQEAPEGYTLENIETDPRCEVNHTKIRMNGTVLLSNGETEDGRPHGIWIDLFAWDKLETNVIRQLPFRLQTAKLFLLTRANGSHYNEDAIKKLGRLLFRVFTPKMRCRGQKHAMTWLRRHDRKTTDRFQWTSTSSFGGLKLRMEPCFPLQLTKISFEGVELPIFANCDTYLKAAYGDYMRLPPVEEQVCTHDPIKLVFKDQTPA